MLHIVHTDTAKCCTCKLQYIKHESKHNLGACFERESFITCYRYGQVEPLSVFANMYLLSISLKMSGQAERQYSTIERVECHEQLQPP